jgi:hypothetical protein
LQVFDLHQALDGLKEAEAAGTGTALRLSPLVAPTPPNWFFYVLSL